MAGVRNPALAEAIRNDRVILHHSMLNTLASCEQKFDFDYTRGYLRDESRPMELGSWLHALVAAHYLDKGLREDTLLRVPETVDLGFDGFEAVPMDDLLASVDPLPEAVLALLESRLWRPLPKEVKEVYNGSDPYYESLEMELPRQAWDIYTRWAEHWEERHEGEKVLLVEHQWTSEYGGLTFGGRIDSCIERADGFVTIRDAKSTSKQPSMAYRLTNQQLSLYAWGVAGLLKEHGLKPQMMEFDYLITSAPGKVRIKNDGTPYANIGANDRASLNRQILAYNEGMPKEDHITPEMFEKNIKKWGWDTWNNDTHPFFQRWETVVNPVTVKKVLDELTQGWMTAQQLLLGEATPVRSLHPVMCGMCHRKDECAIDFMGGEPDRVSKRTLPTLDGDLPVEVTS